MTLALLVLGQFGIIQADTGRDFPRCMQSCNTSSKACKVQCDVDCTALFPAGDGRDACVLECDTICIGNSKECKNTCKNIKNPPSTPEP